MVSEKHQFACLIYRSQSVSILEILFAALPPSRRKAQKPLLDFLTTSSTLCKYDESELSDARSWETKSKHKKQQSDAVVRKDAHIWFDLPHSLFMFWIDFTREL